MLFDWILLYLFSLITCLYFIRPIWVGLMLFIIMIFLFKIYIKFRVTRTHINYPKYNEHQLHNELKHGDILFSHEYNSHNVIINFFLKYFNYNISHGSLIVEENDVKYVIEANPGETSLSKDYIITTFNTLNGLWTITKMPLIEYLKIYGTFIYVVFRKENILLTHYNIIEPSSKSIYYCTMMVGDIIEKNGLIPKTNRLFRYRPTELITLLKENGYTSFYSIKY